MRRAGLRRMRRSLAYAAAGLPKPEREAALDALAAQPSASHAEVREAIRWARRTADEPPVAGSPAGEEA